MRIKTTLAMCAAAGLVTGAMAGPPSADMIGEGARLMVHVDLEALNGSDLGEWFISKAEADSNNFEDVQEMFPGFSLRGEGGLDSVTAYATGLTNDGPDGLIVIIQGNENLKGWDERLGGMLAEQGSEPAKIGGHSAHLIPMDEETGFLSLIRNNNGYAWVLGLSADSLGTALSVIDGEADTISDGARETMGTMWQRGTIAMVGTSDLDILEEIKPASAVLSMANHVWARLGERGGELEAQLVVHPQNEEHSQKMAAVFQGVLAFGAMMNQDNEEFADVMELISSLDISADDGALSISFEYDSEAVIEMIESHEEEWIEVEYSDDDEIEYDGDDEI